MATVKYSAKRFSETQFSFCYVQEFLQKQSKIIMPIFPTLRAEKKLGYDVKIGRSLFLQFKRPSIRANNVYQIEISLNQFNILYKLKHNKPYNKVFYVAPLFHTNSDMRKFYVAGEIENNSAHFALENFPPKLNKSIHRLNYEYGRFGSAPLSTIPLTIHGSKPKGTFGVLNSDPICIDVEYGIFEKEFQADPNPMKLIEKANYLLANVIPESVRQKYDIVDPVHKLYSILISYYNILWIPII
jgi:hypothetical protein